MKPRSVILLGAICVVGGVMYFHVGLGVAAIGLILVDMGKQLAFHTDAEKVADAMKAGEKLN